jgi:phenylacetate-CoA ligase
MNRLEELIYNISPIPVQNIIISVYGYYWAHLKYSGKFYPFLKWLEKTERLSRKELRELQTKELKRIINYSYYNVPYYRRIFRRHSLKPDDIRTIEDLKKIPILTKEDLRYNFNSLISQRYHRWQYSIKHTSGTTGTALNVVWGNEATMKEYAFVERIRRRAGINSKEPHATFAGRIIVPLRHTKPPFWRYNSAEKQYYFSMHHLTKENLKYYTNKLRQINPSYIEGYPSLIYVVAEYVLKYEDSIPVKAVFTSSETLLSYQRESIEKAFQCKVFDRYGMTELAASIGECEEGGYHIDAEYGIIEFLKDGEEVSEGEVGEMVCTSFINDAFPLIRYKIGDLARPVGGTCSCGRTLPLVKEIIGRIDDVLITKRGAYLGRLDHIFKEMHNIKESQIIQESIDKITVKVVPREEFSERDVDKLIEEFQKRLGTDMEIEIKLVDQIPREKSGKFKAVISKVPFRL